MKSKQWKKIGIILLFLAVAAFALNGCSSGSDGAAGAPGATGATGPAGPAGPAAGTDVSSMTVEELGTALESSTVTVDSVTIASPPVVKFTLKDANGNGITGLNQYTTSAVPGLEYIKFNIAKLVPGANGSPSKWVNYIVTTAVAPPASPAYLYPAYESQGNLVDNGGGSYTYTFYRDLAKIKDTAHAEDVTYEPTLTHRLVIVVTPPEAEPPAKFWRCTNTVFDFTIDPTTKAAIPLTATSARRDITTTARCNSCHTDISKMFMNNAFNDGHHFDTRPDVRNCINCHTAQLGLVLNAAGTVVPGATSTNGAFAAPTESNRRYQPRIADGESLFDFPVMIHKLHMGENLAKTGYNFDGVLFNEGVYTQEIINCRKCHSADTAADLAATPQGDNWKNKPSRLACGSCHDYINWATGGDYRGAGFPGHPGIGGARADDSLCVLCHTPSYIETVHTSINATPNNPSVPAGATNFTYEISSVTVGTGADLNKPIVKFRIMAVTPPATTATPVTFVTSVGGTAPLTGFTGAPSFLVAYAKTQDGITAPADFNNLGNGVLGAQPVSVSIAKLCDTSVTATATVGSQGSMTGPDASGYYTATLTGPTTTIRESVYGSTTATAVTATNTVQGVVKGTATTSVGMMASPAMPANPALFPVGANLRTVALQGYFTQVTPALARHSTMVMKAVGETSATVRGEARRLVVDSAKCAQCHEYFEGHGGNRNYNMDGCTVCHNPNLSSSGTIINDPTTPEATQNLKDMIHSIHAAGMRENPYKHTRSKSGSNTIYDWSDVVYPAALKVCETCHKPGTYGSVPSDALATTDVTPVTGLPGGTVFDARVSLPNTTDILISPYSAACVSCHDSAAAKAHMETNGGKVSKARSTFTPLAEACATCHAAGKVQGVDVVHQ